MPDLRTPFEGVPPPVVKPVTRGILSSAAISARIKQARLKKVKRVFIFLFLIVLAAAVGTSWKNAFATGAISTASVAAPIIFAAMYPFAALSLRWTAVLILNTLTALAMVLPSSDLASPLPIIVNALLVMLFETAAWGSIAGRLKTYVAFKMSGLAGGFGALVIAFSALFAGVYYQATMKPALDRGEFFVSERTFEKILVIAEPVIAKSFPGFRPDLTVGDFLGLADDPANAALMVAQLSDRIGAPITRPQTVASVLRAYVGAEWRSLQEPLPRFAITAVMLLIFLFAWSIGVAARPVIAAVSWTLLQLLIGLKLFGIARESVEQRRLELL